MDMQSYGVSAKKIKEKVDQEAAVKILETFLASPKKKLYSPETVSLITKEKSGQAL